VNVEAVVELDDTKLMRHQRGWIHETNQQTLGANQLSLCPMKATARKK